VPPTTPCHRRKPPRHSRLPPLRNPQSGNLWHSLRATQCSARVHANDNQIEIDTNDLHHLSLRKLVNDAAGRQSHRNADQTYTVTNHPAGMFLPDVCERVDDDGGRIERRRVDGYSNDALKW
jgi:hypothetical protein